MVENASAQDPTPPNGLTIPRPVVAALALASLVLALRHAAVLVPSWQAWRAGTPDPYPGRRWRVTLWLAWAASLGGSVAMMSLR